jgi:hypothetical protein
MVANSTSAEHGSAVSDTARPNKSLDGHKLLMLSDLAPPEHLIKELQAKFPGLKVDYRPTSWASKVPGGDGFKDEDWKDVTILLTGNTFPASSDIAPKLQYVQLQSAGANMVLKHPLFLDGDVTFCTANGVAGE